MDLNKSSLCVRNIQLYDDRVLSISQCYVGDVGCVVWDAALVLLHYLDHLHFATKVLTGKHVVELGSGTGAVGLLAAACGADCHITDLKSLVPLMELNIHNNKDLVSAFGGRVSAKELKWGSDYSNLLPRPDILLLADCIYYEESLEPLVKTIDDISGPHTTVFCCYEKRASENKLQIEQDFFNLLKKKFEAESVEIEAMHPLFHSDDIHIKILRRKCEET